MNWGLLDIRETAAFCDSSCIFMTKINKSKLNIVKIRCCKMAEKALKYSINL